MSDNEKRAHDLAVALTVEFTKPEYAVSGQHLDDGCVIQVDPYAKYKEIYDAVLPKLNEDFPNGK